MSLPFAFGATALWGAADFLAALDAGRTGVFAALLASQPLGLAAATVWVGVGGDPVPPPGALAVAALGGVVGALAVAALWLAMNRTGFGIASPISASGVLVPFAYGLLVGRPPSTAQLVGCAVAICGLLCIVAPARGQTQATGQAVALALGAAAGFGFLFVAVAAASRTNAAWALLASRLGGTGVVAAALVWRPQLRPPPSTVPRRATAAGFLEAGGSALYALATHTGRVALAAVASSLYPAVTALLARLLLGERLRPAQRIGGALIAAGAALLAS